MGMYTGLRVKVIVKEEFREMIECINKGDEWSAFSEEHPFLSNYSQQHRAEFIPNGVLCYMPDSWTVGVFPLESATDGFETNIDMNTGLWSFQCSLKNYNGEIEQFFEEVLPSIIESSNHIEYFYEEWDESVMYKYLNGKIVKCE